MSEKFSYKVKRALSKIVDGLMSQEENKGGSGEVHIPDGMATLARKVVAEGAVLLKNNDTLPLQKGTRVSVFGRVQVDYFAVGYGSGGDVNEPYIVNVLEGLRSVEEIQLNEDLAGTYELWSKANPVDHGFWGNWPRYYPEMPVTSELAKKASAESDVALVVIGRAAGEDRENELSAGSYYLTDDETNMLERVTGSFEKVVVMINSGNIMDLAWIEDYGDKIDSVLFAWQGGMESGNALADVLTGKVTPSGKLANAYARHYENYPSATNFGNREFNNYAEDIYIGYRYFETFLPDAMLYPFGYGLSYTSFEMTTEKAQEKDGIISLNIRVTNTGDTFSGKETVQVYFGAPQGKLGKPVKTLVAFAKTKNLAPSDTQNITITFPVAEMASFDDGGFTGHAFCFVLEAGDYPIYVGNDAHSASEAFVYRQEKLEVTKENLSVMEVEEENRFERLKPTLDESGKLIPAAEQLPTNPIGLTERILENLPVGVPITLDKGYKLIDVYTGKVTMDAFIGQLTLDELEAISRGDYKMGSLLGAAGNAGVLGGVLESLRDKGIVPVTATDGPSGVRLHAVCSLLPCGTLLACTWDTELVEELYAKMGEEMIMNGSDVLLAPGMNIHRDPLCGRNFEYFSEDPLITGLMAAAMVRGIQSQGVAACPKHFVANNQETNRNKNDSRVSQRALREIYLRAFEICVQESNPQVIMTSYNKVNGIWSHYNYDLNTTVLRGDWDYQGIIVTDWWMQNSKDPNFPKLREQAYRVRAQVDVLMPGGKRVGASRPDGTLLKSYHSQGGIKAGEMQRVARNVLNFVMKSQPFLKANNLETTYEKPESHYFTTTK